MSTDNPHFDKLLHARELINALCEGDYAPEKLQELEALVLNDAAVRQLYIKMVHLQAGLYQHAPMVAALVDCECDFTPRLDHTMALPSLPEVPGAPQDNEPKPLELPYRTVEMPTGQRHLHRWIGFAALIALLVGLGLLLGIHHPAATFPSGNGVIAGSAVSSSKPMAAATQEVESVGPVVATIINSIDARWGAHTGDVATDDAATVDVLRGASLDLQAGYAEMAFTGGAHVIIQAPAQFHVASATAINLSSGRLVANVPGGGFVVETPSASVTDLGTEFGVGVDTLGQTRVDVYKGKVQAAPVAEGGAATPSKVLSEGEAARVTRTGVKIDPGGASPQRFVRSLNNEEKQTPLDLVDVVCGGDGSTHRRGTTISVTTGASGMLPLVMSQIGDHLYHRVPALPAVDGCFIPDGTYGPVQVDSAGDRFKFQPTTNHTSYHLWAGGAHPQPDDHISGFSTCLQGIDYGLDGHAVIFTHCNKGLTLNLDVLRSLHPTRSIVRFRCITGNSSSRAYRTKADARILIDAVPRFEKLAFSTRDGPFQINIPITDANHFLTFASTDGGDNTGHDWVIWADPLLDTSPKPAASISTTP